MGRDKVETCTLEYLFHHTRLGSRQKNRKERGHSQLSGGPAKILLAEFKEKLWVKPLFIGICFVDRLQPSALNCRDIELRQ